MEYAFGRLKTHFGCLRREMFINIRELPNLINSCFALNSFCEEKKEPLNQEHIDIALNTYKEFQSLNDNRYKVSNSKTGRKAIREIYVKYFEWKICYARRLCFD